MSTSDEKFKKEMEELLKGTPEAASLPQLTVNPVTGEQENWKEFAARVAAKPMGRPLSVNKAPVRAAEDGSGCILWTGSTDGYGNPTRTVKGCTVRVRQEVFREAFGYWPRRLQVNTCGKKNCINAEHMRESKLTRQEQSTQAKAEVQLRQLNERIDHLQISIDLLKDETDASTQAAVQQFQTELTKLSAERENVTKILSALAGNTPAAQGTEHNTTGKGTDDPSNALGEGATTDESNS